jgi:hypothetical protein
MMVLYIMYMEHKLYGVAAETLREEERTVEGRRGKKEGQMVIKGSVTKKGEKTRESLVENKNPGKQSRGTGKQHKSTINEEVFRSPVCSHVLSLALPCVQRLSRTGVSRRLRR